MNRKIDRYESDEIKAVFTFLKTAKTITGLSETGGVTTITSNSLVLLAVEEPIYLKTGQYVTISNVNYQVSNVNLDLKTFDITGINIIATSWNLAINFQFGSMIEVNQILAEQREQSTAKNNRFPLVWMFINEGRDHENTLIDFETNIKLAFVGLSQAGWKAQQRLDSNMKLVLQPLLTLFLEAVQSPFFSTVFDNEYKTLKYKDFYRYFYGSSDKSKSIFDDPTDAIEIDLSLTFKKKYY
jgi:hypothetical protein